MNIRFRLRFFHEQITWFQRIIQTRLNLTPITIRQQNSITVQTSPSDSTSQELDKMFDILQDLNRIYQFDADYLTDRLYQQMDCISHLVNQRNSRISLAIADINNEMAWQAKTSSHQMTLAAASLIFLPATFIASLFDTPIFNWQPKSDEVIVREPFIIYWCTCAATTLFLASCWFVYLKWRKPSEEAERQSTRKEFRKKILTTTSLARYFKPHASGAQEGVGTLLSWHSYWQARKPCRQDEGVGSWCREADQTVRVGDENERMMMGTWWAVERYCKP